MVIKTDQLLVKADPFLKWAGGKGQLLKQYIQYIPRKFNNYIEPFVGGGAVFFYLINNGYINDDKEVVLIDSNDELINCYKIIKSNVTQLISVLNSSSFLNNEDIYYMIRDTNPQDPIEKAARTIYLNKTCFNGLYRVNSRGQFNVPFGKYANPLICNGKNLEAVSVVLSKVNLICDDFNKCLEFAKKDDFIYFDPPYQPLSKTANFTSYTKSCFDKQEQIRLYNVFNKLDNIGCKVMLSNSETDLIRELYKKFRIQVVLANRAINCKASGRGKINELVILNY
jgi:DNA adenine methylase